MRGSIILSKRSPHPHFPLALGPIALHCPAIVRILGLSVVRPMKFHLQSRTRLIHLGIGLKMSPLQNPLS